MHDLDPPEMNELMFSRFFRPQHPLELISRTGFTSDKACAPSPERCFWLSADQSSFFFSLSFSRSDVDGCNPVSLVGPYYGLPPSRHYFTLHI
jgi:hypothetical protein